MDSAQSKRDAWSRNWTDAYDSEEEQLASAAAIAMPTQAPRFLPLHGAGGAQAGGPSSAGPIECELLFVCLGAVACAAFQSAHGDLEALAHIGAADATAADVLALSAMCDAENTTVYRGGASLLVRPRDAPGQLGLLCASAQLDALSPLDLVAFCTALRCSVSVAKQTLVLTSLREAELRLDGVRPDERPAPGSALYWLTSGDGSCVAAAWPGSQALAQPNMLAGAAAMLFERALRRGEALSIAITIESSWAPDSQSARAFEPVLGAGVATARVKRMLAGLPAPARFAVFS